VWSLYRAPAWVTSSGTRNFFLYKPSQENQIVTKKLRRNGEKDEIDKKTKTKRKRNAGNKKKKRIREKDKKVIGR
jgi:hypothetical protein